MTRFSNLHAYPAMVPDTLATELASRFVRPGDRVLDPFCGSGRLLLAAAERGAQCVGLDVNPVAILLVTAKCTWAGAKLIELAIKRLDSASMRRITTSHYDLEPGRKVRWFSPQATAEICEILDFLNYRLPHSSLLPLAAAVLSATTRDVSYCRKDQWKLHRMSAEDRSRWDQAVWPAFRDRFTAALRELGNYQPLLGKCVAIREDARTLSTATSVFSDGRPFDLVITSPPYGDSRTTVQYGGMSGLSLGVLRHLRALKLDVIRGIDIDRLCLGGSKVTVEIERLPVVPLSWYWHGGRDNLARSRVVAFARDMELCCEQVGSALRKGGLAVFVVARRSAGGWRVYLDKLLISLMRNAGMRLVRRFVRQIPYKVTPFLIHRRARAKDNIVSSRDFVPTMREEFILVFRRI
jgi:site-specific DNA-methyltransferase (cytosine-N4-specific)